MLSGSFSPWEYAFACYLALNEPPEVFRKVGNGNFGYLVVNPEIPVGSGGMAGLPV